MAPTVHMPCSGCCPGLTCSQNCSTELATSLEVLLGHCACCFAASISGQVLYPSGLFLSCFCPPTPFLCDLIPSLHPCVGASQIYITSPEASQVFQTQGSHCLLYLTRISNFSCPKGNQVTFHNTWSGPTAGAQSPAPGLLSKTISAHCHPHPGSGITTYSSAQGRNPSMCRSWPVRPCLPPKPLRSSPPLGQPSLSPGQPPQRSPRSHFDSRLLHQTHTEAAS